MERTSLLVMVLGTSLLLTSCTGPEHRGGSAGAAGTEPNGERGRKRPQWSTTELGACPNTKKTGTQNDGYRLFILRK